MRDLQEALHRVWKILEYLYGYPRELLDSAFRDNKCDEKCLVGKILLSQSYRTKPHNLKSVAESICMSNKLLTPKLIFRVVDGFSLALCAQF